MRSDGSRLLDQKQPRREGALGHFARAGPGCGPLCICTAVSFGRGPFFALYGPNSISRSPKKKKKKKKRAAGPAPTPAQLPELGRKRLWAKRFPAACLSIVQIFSFSFFIFQKHLIFVLLSY
jgi:hypothetical protein